MPWPHLPTRASPATVVALGVVVLGADAFLGLNFFVCLVELRAG
ncbi:hypothetical protein ABZY45_20605 [Streptomyces sp. NPDC006516]